MRTNRVTQIVKPIAMVEDLFNNYAQNPFHIDLPKYFTDDTIALPDAEERLLTFLGNIVQYEIVEEQLCSCEIHGRIELLTYRSVSEEDTGQRTVFRFERCADHFYRFDDIRLFWPGGEGMLDGRIESIFGRDMTTEMDELREMYLEAMSDDDEDYFDEMPGFSIN